MENSQDKIEEIDLTKIDWNNLSLDAFQKISHTIEEKSKLNRVPRERKKRTAITLQPITIRGLAFELPSNLIERLVALKDGKPKEKLIDEIFQTYQPMEML